MPKEDYEQLVFKTRTTSTGLYIEAFKTHGKSQGGKITTIRPAMYEPGSPYFSSWEVPTESLLTEDQLKDLLNSKPSLHPAMTL